MEEAYITGSAFPERVVADLGDTGRLPRLKTSGNVHDVRDYGAVGDGVADDTAAIAATFTAAGTGDLVNFPPGTYPTSQALDKRDVHVRGDRATLLYRGAAREYMAILRGASSVAGLVVDGAHLSAKGIDFRPGSTDAVIVASCTFRNLRQHDGFGHSAGMVVRGAGKLLALYGSVFQDIDSVHSTSPTSRGVVVYHSGGSAPGVPERISIRGNVFDSITPSADADAVFVQSNDYAGNDYSGVTVIAGNTFRDCAKRAVKLQCSHARVSGNHFECVREGAVALVDLQGGHDYLVETNTFLYSGTTAAFAVSVGVNPVRAATIRNNTVRAPRGRTVTQAFGLAGAALDDIRFEDNAIEVEDGVRYLAQIRLTATETNEKKATGITFERNRISAITVSLFFMDRSGSYWSWVEVQRVAGNVHEAGGSVATVTKHAANLTLHVREWTENRGFGDYMRL